jgi:hypothetical protein
MNDLDFLVRKDRLTETELREVTGAPLTDGRVRLAIDRFSFTANNVSYAAAGDTLNYWAFFPAPEGWGRIPVWGFATVVESAHPDLATGERIWGYYPMSTHVVLEPERVSRHGFFDGALHRKPLFAIYNQYSRCSVDSWHTDGWEDVEALLRPLFATSWLVDDFLADQAFYGADTLLLSSASSKTAYGTAVQLRRRAGMDVVGLTSAANVAFCESLGCYSRVLTYAQLDRVAADAASVYIDFAGNADLRSAIHTRFANLKYDCAVGATHIDQRGSAKGLPGPRVAFFFAPAQAAKRIGEWGEAGLMGRIVADWKTFSRQVMSPPAPWLTIEQHRGPDAVQAIYAQVLAGGGDPRVGHMLTLARSLSDLGDDAR